MAKNTFCCVPKGKITLYFSEYGQYKYYKTNYSGFEFTTLTESPLLENIPKEVALSGYFRSEYSFSNNEKAFFGTLRYFSPYRLHSSLVEIDITSIATNPDGTRATTYEHEGMIKGCYFTSNAGKFIFYDKNNKPFATAYLDRTKSKVIITEYENKDNKLAQLKKAYNRTYKNSSYFWEITVKDEQTLPAEHLTIFASYLTNTYVVPNYKICNDEDYL